MIHKKKKQTYTASYTISYGIAKKEVKAVNVMDAVNQLPQKALKNLFSLVDDQGHDHITELFI
jgi:uncharacterized protein YycO